MDKEKLLFVNEAAGTWSSSCNYHGSDEQLNNNGFFNPSWENSMDQSDPFESALSSIVSSPVASNATAVPPPAGDSFTIRELIGRLGSICNSAAGGGGGGSDGDVSPQSYLQQQPHHHDNNNNNSTNNSCYINPLSSPPKLNLSMMDPPTTTNHPNLAPSMAAADPGFAERAARLSCFGTRTTFGLESGKLSRVSSNQSMIKVASGSQMNAQDGNSNNKTSSLSPENGDSKEESSVSEPQIQNDANSRKRKSVGRGGKVKETTTTPFSTTDVKVVVTENEESNTKRSKQEENSKAAAEPLKDYIHVRARRGQATDSHSLAERVRREKISERMKFLQDLVPGCNKVTGKAVMLDEIINYVQSLQRQVEFLSMKLATVNPRMDFNVEALLSKDLFQSRVALQNALYQVDTSAAAPPPPTFPFGYQPQQDLPPNNADTQFSINPLNNAAALNRNPDLQLPSNNGYGETPSQVPLFWEDDLQSLVQMGFTQNQHQPESFHGSMASAQMKIEL
ncbi:hypothetical protein ACOSP7_006987 [Xanthoceras sorbifolium]|uniref:BHLH domain-containing protein n=1 Tax=Xanthoceras sorbifolium TaxID=99658 RepID=A0ABQ8H004_9ROSI|nr:hypothetical protein JRO89_XSUnG0036500 [Xanthoceras sorbifolium]